MGEARSQPAGEAQLTHRRTGRGEGGEGGCSPPQNFGQLRFFGQQVKFWAKPVLKDISMFLYYFEEVNISYFNLKLA